MKNGVYNIALSASFFDTLAKRFIDEFYQNPIGLSDVLFLVQNRRSVLSLKEAFLRQNGLSPFLLPQIKAIGDVDADDLFVGGKSEALDIKPSVTKEERLFLFAKLIASKRDVYGLKDISFVQALALAADLGNLMDGIYDENLSFDGFEKLVPEEYASHFQETLKFLKIVTSFWPDILKERGVVDGAYKKNKLLELEAKQWLQKPPEHKIVAAGLNTSFDGAKHILSALLTLENGEIYLSGLDRYLPDDVFDLVAETHPQFENKSLLKHLGLKREDVEDITVPQNFAREILISEVMRPAETTSSWQDLKQKLDFNKAYEGLHLMECRETFEEASSIALLMREVLEVPQKTAVLITTDRTLARAVSAALKRFGIDIDDSAGLPLHLSEIGIYLRQIIDVIEKNFSPVCVAALLKNPYMRMGRPLQDLRREVRAAELKKRMPAFNQKPEEILEDDALTAELRTYLSELSELYQKEDVELQELITVHLQVAESLASDNQMSGAQNLWRHDDGKAAAAYFAKLIEKAPIAGNVWPQSYGAIVSTLLSTQSVRKTYGTHPRLKILGPIEARGCRYDVTIIGGLNEGVWPVLENADPFMSRTMKKEYGLPVREKAIGVGAFDLSTFLASKEVYLTRSQRSNGTPTDKSRYWLRIETILRLFDKDVSSVLVPFYPMLAQKIDTPDAFCKIEPAAPKPPVYARPRHFSASSIEKLMRNPYEIYARYILKLKVLEDLTDQIKQTTYGTIVHKVLENFAKIYDSSFDDKALEVLLELGQKEFSRYRFEAKDKAFYTAKFEKTAQWLIKNEQTYRSQIKHIFSEVKGQINLSMPTGDVIIEARADRIDETKDGCYRILDYKTGKARTKAEIKSGYAPQLPIEALIAHQGGFSKDGRLLGQKKVDALIYEVLSKKITVYDEDIDDLIEKTKQHLVALISAFDFQTTPYLARPNPKHLDEYADYEHLARVKEWSVTDGDE